MRSRFKPLFRDKKSGRIVVNGYGSWRKYFKMDFNRFTIDEEYLSLDENEYVYNRNGQQLFFYDYLPSDIKSTRLDDPNCLNWRTDYGNGATFCCRGLDVDGVPCFCHYDADRVASNSLDWINLFKPLTVKTVRMWFDWMMMNKVNEVTVNYYK